MHQGRTHPAAAAVNESRNFPRGEIQAHCEALTWLVAGWPPKS